VRWNQMDAAGPWRKKIHDAGGSNRGLDVTQKVARAGCQGPESSLPCQLMRKLNWRAQYKYRSKVLIT